MNERKPRPLPLLIMAIILTWILMSGCRLIGESITIPENFYLTEVLQDEDKMYILYRRNDPEIILVYRKTGDAYSYESRLEKNRNESQWTLIPRDGKEEVVNVNFN